MRAAGRKNCDSLMNMRQNAVSGMYRPPLTSIAPGRTLGMDLVGDQVHRDVPQVTVSFSAHRLLDPAASADETRRQLKRRAFDHLLTMPGASA